MIFLHQTILIVQLAVVSTWIVGIEKPDFFFFWSVASSNSSPCGSSGSIFLHIPVINVAIAFYVYLLLFGNPLAFLKINFKLTLNAVSHLHYFT